MKNETYFQGIDNRGISILFSFYEQKHVLGKARIGSRKSIFSGHRKLCNFNGSFARFSKIANRVAVAKIFHLFFVMIFFSDILPRTNPSYDVAIIVVIMSVVTTSPSRRQLQETTMDQASDVFVTNADDELLGAMKTAALADDAPRMNQLLAKFYEHSEQLQEVGGGGGGRLGGGRGSGRG